MRLVIGISALLATAAILSPVSIDRQAHERPCVDRVEPDAAERGAVVTAYGVSLDRSHVMDLILRGSDSYVLTHIIEQRDDRIVFEIPRSPASGQYSIILVLGAPFAPELVDQEVLIAILD